MIANMLSNNKLNRTNSTSYFTMIIQNKQELINHLFEIDFKDFMKLYKKCTSKLYFFLVLNTDNPLRFRHNFYFLDERI